MFLALGHHADEVADDHHGAYAGNVGDGRLVDGLERVADVVALLGADVWRAYDPAVQHAALAYVVDEDQVAGKFGRDVDARLALADDAIVGDRFDGGVLVEMQDDRWPGQELAVLDRLAALGIQDDAALDAQAFGREIQVGGGSVDQPGAGLRGGEA